MRPTLTTDNRSMDFAFPEKERFVVGVLLRSEKQLFRILRSAIYFVLTLPIVGL